MGKVPSFEELATKIESFEPPYTEEFRQYIENSIAESRRADAEANGSAAKVIIT